ncbi:MAG: hypothetical protein AAB425_06220 [Bdellovibrionota bacterium]
MLIAMSLGALAACKGEALKTEVPASEASTVPAAPESPAPQNLEPVKSSTSNIDASETAAEIASAEPIEMASSLASPEPSATPSAPPSAVPAAPQLMDVAAPDPTAGWPRVYLHYDYMVAASGHSHEPSASAIQLVVDAFQRQGVVLDIDPVHHPIPESMVVTLDPQIIACSGADSIDIGEVKTRYYKARNAQEHYAVFAHYNTCSSPGACTRCKATPRVAGNQQFGTTGIAAVGGRDLIVSLGQLVDFGLEIMPDVINAGTLMHELGHNFGLLHGGGDHVNEKPNYLSVMNYTYQYGIGTVKDPHYRGTTAEDPTLEEYVIDYSDRALPALHEGILDRGQCVSDGRLQKPDGMNEERGLNDHSNKVVVFFRDDPEFGVSMAYSVANGNPIDWNFNGNSTENSAYADVNGDGQCTILNGFDDWAAVKSFLKRR